MKKAILCFLLLTSFVAEAEEYDLHNYAPKPHIMTHEESGKRVKYCKVSLRYMFDASAFTLDNLAPAKAETAEMAKMLHLTNKDVNDYLKFLGKNLDVARYIMSMASDNDSSLVYLNQCISEPRKYVPNYDRLK